MTPKGARDSVSVGTNVDLTEKQFRKKGIWAFRDGLPRQILITES
jgi:hypothetical protein